MTKKELESRLCDIRCELEEIANDCYEEWKTNHNECVCDRYKMDWNDLSDEIQRIAEDIAVYEDELFKELQNAN